ncbi:MAG TPA: hypothetical protein DD789_10580 [Firmicutes bacterium]|nr:hypothetical protein [Bacillota bacterium]
MKKILVVVLCLGFLFLYAPCTLGAFEVYYDGFFTGKFCLKASEAEKVETDFSLHAFGGRLYLSDLLLGAEVGTGEIKKSKNFSAIQDLETISFIVGYRFNINEFSLLPFISADEMNMKDSLNNKRISGISPGVEAKVPFSDRFSIEGSYKLALFSIAYELNGRDIDRVIQEDLGEQDISIKSSAVKISALSFKAKYLITENIALVGGYKKNITKLEINAEKDPFGAEIPIEFEQEESLDSITFGASILF